MDTQDLSPVENIIKLVKERQHFILQGGAGSGKTESLQQVVKILLETDQTLKIACITHTNKAADEIQSRVQSKTTVSTIHSFLSSLIKPYRRNIKVCFPELFILPHFEARGAAYYGGDDKVFKKEEHNRYKKLYEKLAARRKIVLEKNTEKPTRKPDYDKDSSGSIDNLNALIVEVNTVIREQLARKEVEDFVYNETRFNNFHSTSYGHDGLLEISTQLFDRYPNLAKIIADRYDCIFIDEYQDANSDVIRVLLDNSSVKPPVIGLFGDSEQAIYDEGIGSAQEHIDSNKLVLVEKIDNYRCSQQVIDLANQFRTDGLTQEVALKKLESGVLETLESRQGKAKFYYALAPIVEDTGEEKTDRENHKLAKIVARDTLVEKVTRKYDDFIQLKLTNKSIAKDVGFEKLYEIFSSRYNEPRDRIEKILARLQFDEIVELVRLYQSVDGDRRAYNQLISKLSRHGFIVKSVGDKKALESLLKLLITDNKSAYETIQFAMENRLIIQSDSHKILRDRSLELQKRLEKDPVFGEFELLNSKGKNTLLRMKAALPDKDVKLLDTSVLDERFEEMEKDLKDKQFFEALFSCDLPFAEVSSFYDYITLDRDSRYSTMHKTKGTGIDDVIVVLDDYGWVQKYNFESCFSGRPPNTDKEIRTRKLLYVACSRAKKNLICVRLVQDNAEADKIKEFFEQSELVDLSL